jgi:hypothetical protein
LSFLHERRHLSFHQEQRAHQSTHNSKAVPKIKICLNTFLLRFFDSNRSLHDFSFFFFCNRFNINHAHQIFYRLSYYLVRWFYLRFELIKR